MEVEYPIAEVPATPDYVLGMLRDLSSDTHPDADWPTFDTSVSELAEEWNDTILFWWEFARLMNEFTQLNLPSGEWKPVLSPMRERTVGDLCRFIAERIQTRPAIRPWPYVAGECLPAGAFLTARAILARCGADANSITPSTPIAEYLRRFGAGWVYELAEMAPGRLPAVEASHPLEGVSCGTAVVGFSLLLLGWLVGGDGGRVAAGCGVSLFFAAILSLTVADRLLRWRITIGELRTFRDLAYCLAGQEPRRAIKPTA
jgi:hypothetical protein